MNSINANVNFSQDFMSTNSFCLPQSHCISNKCGIMVTSINKGCWALLKLPLLLLLCVLHIVESDLLRVINCRTNSKLGKAVSNPSWSALCQIEVSNHQHNKQFVSDSPGLPRQSASHGKSIGFSFFPNSLQNTFGTFYNLSP